jgi:hypothetical protein
MKKVLLLLLTMMCLPIPAIGAQIYGTLRWNNASVGAGVPVNIQCMEGPAYKGSTDAYGSYSVPLRISKKCGLSVYFGNQWSKPFDVYPYEDPVRYDFDLIRGKDGTLGLRRR